ncbi:DUF2218 domain-containing protein [Metapseudomonas otitidis]|jgi:hypothetical protein|uniref:DUF2218 domain-containing protein n=1 Tax=Pseudomonadaceae TaxID=135621 RepID=UPI0005CA6F01|nr:MULTISPECIES: DUF2218 domain-containing protein [Pseudomonas]KIV74565.1 hypothetical protein SZ55_0702 [Pseudomonas sp. FeS53a]MCO7553622.1 DUF2218 domain-containing protein [Pseudomonas otitidis]WAF85306.1 DUF2218 domain-containing protein [Pseudomonas otitidis]
MTLVASTHVVTETPARYISRLCKHFAHRIPVSHDEQQGRIQFDIGLGLLQAEAGGLTLRVEAEDAVNLERLKEVMASHFERFAWQEALQLNWH